MDSGITRNEGSIMPQMADIIVKKADAATNVTYSALTPSSGDKVPAQWRSETAGASAALRPTFEMVSRWNGPRTARRVDFSYQYPYTVTDTTTSTTSVKARVPLNGSFVIPAEVPDTVLNEAVSQGLNLVGATLPKSSFLSGYAPN
jgi:hypothetical protein